MSESISILVTGSNGQVGQELQALAPSFSDWKFTFVDIAELDITDPAAVTACFIKNDFTHCFNCAAYTAVDRAESDAATAERVNVLGPSLLAKACQATGAHLLQLSTDYVYHNSQNTPFKEDDSTKPQGVYAVTKLRGDEAVLANCETSTVIRTSWVYSSFGNNFVKTMLRLGQEREQLNVIFDQIGTATYARDLAKAMLQIVAKVEKGEVSPENAKGIFHYSNEGVMSWYDFAQAIFELSDVDCHVFPIETKEYPTPAARPPFSLLNKGKIKAIFGLEIPYWRDSLRECLDLLAKS